MTQPRTRRRARDLTPHEYARRYQAAYGAPPSNPIVRLFFAAFYIAAFLVMLVFLQWAAMQLAGVDPFAFVMTQVFHTGHVEIVQSAQPTAAIAIPPRHSAAIAPQEQSATPVEQPQPVPTAVPQEQAAQPQEQPSDLQAPVQEQAARAVPTAVPTAQPTSAPKPTSWAPTAEPFVVKSDFVKATPDARYTGGWRSLPTH